ncbi:DUF4097 family beta strand repeat protein [bacterium]|nr:DUF4097 family beta strand repeat protein [bacterium]
MAKTFTLPPGAHLCVISPAAPVTVVAQERADVAITAAPDGMQVLEMEGKIVVKVPERSRGPLEIECPEGTDLSVSALSAPISLQGSFGTVKANTTSGDVDLDTAASADLRSVSGDLTVARCKGHCCLAATSGRVQVGDVGGEVKVCSVSGDVDIATRGQGDVMVKSISGDVRILVPPGARPNTAMKSFSGRTECCCEQGNDFLVGCKTFSGRVIVKAGEA